MICGFEMKIAYEIIPQLRYHQTQYSRNVLFSSMKAYVTITFHQILHFVVHYTVENMADDHNPVKSLLSVILFEMGFSEICCRPVV